ncbi:uncharacterized protein MELLADRAFT_106911 [Melampsora larici-populina 98AG31]|uniref:Secreted protein n=1 Tax=Melampsora larici-populina (strain 98AG31 / pathotype 3-4-7) TaxID=747676 RepID=F4RN18_MELLP|nr:uncharacterized protein MELLADRAFT_106911 [Melampsora larici-populina 98AG31]EGG06294.1 secreted protein [Melampsora larici-populina 98AG31]
MRINYGFVAASMALLFVLDFTNTNSVSASSAAEGSRLTRVIRRRSLSTSSVGDNEDSTQVAPSDIRSGAPLLGLSSAMMQRISVGLVSTIAKYSDDMESGVEFPTQEEMTQAVDQALLTSDYTNFSKVAQAIKNSIDGLADRKVAESETGKSRASKVSKNVISNPAAASSADQIATALLDTIHMFCEQKLAGGRLPNASEVNQALTPAFQDIDFGNVKKSTRAVKFGLDQMGPSKNSDVHVGPVITQTIVPVSSSKA